MICSCAPRKAVRPNTELSRPSASRARASRLAGTLAGTGISNLVGSGEAGTVRARLCQVYTDPSPSQIVRFTTSPAWRRNPALASAVIWITFAATIGMIECVRHARGIGGLFRARHHETDVG